MIFSLDATGRGGHGAQLRTYSTMQAVATRSPKPTLDPPSDRVKKVVFPAGSVERGRVHATRGCAARARSRAPGVESGPGTWRFGVQFPDGRKATGFGLGLVRSGGRGSTVTAVAVRVGEPPLEGPVLRAGAGGGSRNVGAGVLAVAPVATRELLITCEWPNAGIDLPTAMVSADLLREAADRAQQLWPAPDLPGWPDTQVPTPPSTSTG
jgi:hypothetical protein